MADELPEAALVPTAMSVINRAVELKMSAAELKELVSLHNDMEDRRARAAFQQAMVLCQQEMPTVVRDRQNPKTQSYFASLDRINVLAHPVYTKHGFYVSYTEAPALKDGWIRTMAVIGHNSGHRETAYLELPQDGIGPKGEVIGGMNKVQGAVSSGSYGQRILLCRLFNISIANTDHDGEEYIEEEDAARLEAILKKIKMPVPQFLLWLKCWGVKPIDPVKPVWMDIRNIYKGMYPEALNDAERRERDFDRKDGAK